MVFKRPAGSREDRPENKKSGENRPRKSPSTPKGKATPNGEKKKLTRPEKTFQTNRFSDDKPKSNFRGGSSAGGDKKFGAKSGPYSGRPTEGNNERARRSFGNDAGEDKKSFAPRGRSSAGFEGKPKRSFSGEQGGERKFGTGSRSGDGNFKPRSSEGGFRKREGGFKDKPFGDRPAHRPQDLANQADAPKTLRGRKKATTKSTKTEDDGLIRLNRYISNAGICSRRKADELIEAGVVSVNGEVVTELGTKVDPTKDTIKYNGETLKREKMVYVLLNKPKDYITTTDDPQERRTVMHLVEKATRERIYPVGRLDRNTTGLLLMTNDGDLADKLSHPRNSITKLYQVELSKSLTQGDLNKLAFGLELEDGLIKPDSVSYVTGGSKREVGIQIHSGKNRIVRRMFEHLGYEVVKLDRVIYANLTKKDLPRGRWRYLEEKEVIQLKHLIK